MMGAMSSDWSAGQPVFHDRCVKVIPLGEYVMTIAVYLFPIGSVSQSEVDRFILNSAAFSRGSVSGK